MMSKTRKVSSSHHKSMKVEVISILSPFYIMFDTRLPKEEKSLSESSVH